MLDHVIEARRANLNHCAIQTRCSGEGSMLEGSSSDPRRLLEDAAKLLDERGAWQRVDLLDRRHSWVGLVDGRHTHARERDRGTDQRDAVREKRSDCASDSTPVESARMAASLVAETGEPASAPRCRLHRRRRPPRLSEIREAVALVEEEHL